MGTEARLSTFRGNSPSTKLLHSSSVEEQEQHSGSGVGNKAIYRTNSVWFLTCKVTVDNCNSWNNELGTKPLTSAEFKLPSSLGSLDLFLSTNAVFFSWADSCLVHTRTGNVWYIFLL